MVETSGIGSSCASTSAVVGQAAQHFVHADAGFQARDVGAQAMVRAGAESQVAVGLAADVELVRPLERFLVAVGRSPAHEHPLALADRLAADFGVARRHPREARLG